MLLWLIRMNYLEGESKVVDWEESGWWFSVVRKKTFVVDVRLESEFQAAIVWNSQQGQNICAVCVPRINVVVFLPTRSWWNGPCIKAELWIITYFARPLDGDKNSSGLLSSAIEPAGNSWVSTEMQTSSTSTNYRNLYVITWKFRKSLYSHY